MKLKLSLRMPCCGNLFFHGDCSQAERERYAKEGYIV